jgi:hypothetical protein
VTGLEVLLVLMGAAALSTTTVALWAYLSETQARRFLADVAAHGVNIEGVTQGDVSAPLSLLVQSGHDQSRVAAVVRGSTPLWHLWRAVSLPATLLQHELVVVDSAWREAAKDARGKVVFVEPELQVGARYDVMAACAADTALLLDDGVRGAVAATLRSEPAATQLTVTSTLLFLELPRDGLSAEGLLCALCRLDALALSLCGEPDHGLRRLARAERGHGDTDVAQSGNPVAVPVLRG